MQVFTQLRWMITFNSKHLYICRSNRYAIKQAFQRPTRGVFDLS